ncbi:DUF3848 domain-containing protein, partial [Dysosmobacter welbionis]
QAVHRLEHLLQGGGVQQIPVGELLNGVPPVQVLGQQCVDLLDTRRLLGAVPGQLPPAGLQPLQIQQQLLELQPEIGQPPHLRLPVQGPEDLLQL